jgi:hypothetical protein
MAETVELRQQIPSDTAQVFDAIAIARMCSRAEVIAEVLNDWAAKRIHEAKILQRVTRGNGAESDTGGNHRQ